MYYPPFNLEYFLSYNLSLFRYYTPITPVKSPANLYSTVLVNNNCY